MEKSCLIYCLRGEEDRLRLIADRRGWAIAHVLTESPATAPDRRAGLAAVRRMVASGEAHALVVPSLLMLGATLDEAVSLIAKMAATNVNLIIEADGINTNTIEGAAWMAAVASLGGYQRALRQEKARAGQRRAQASGVHCGRPALKPPVINKIKELLKSGHGIRPASRLAGCSPARVAMEKKAMIAAENFL